ncbi:phosphoenolpyruvate--protein phosphotransferase [Acidihalobacter prosperus]|uniref:Phosphoenolpyruvate-protein phosphotransferase n=1 Tax=Acidihalobacter prosperus TaxID=160660 RepID=A0A1A6C3I4_9GAMM|nr:phosphoenolpyruvate--protein phosphotransferase [Acidihalobacter prosperus]OBS09119.1 phosphoenolpyruvate--protein phosphotransferase [Acidihalobacter prosperus]
MSLLLNGIGVSRGIAIGRAYRYEQESPEIVERRLATADLPAEIRRFRRALQRAKAELKGVRDRIPENAPADVGTFIDTHLLMLEDGLLAQAPIQHMRALHCNAEWALKLQYDELVATFDAMEDAYLRTRRDDVAHVIGRIQRLLAGHEATSAPASRGDVVVAGDLSPADIASLHDARVAGVITEFGGPLSHTAILLRSLEIPAVVGTHAALRLIGSGETLIIDGDAGLVLAGAAPSLQRHFRERLRRDRVRRATLAKSVLLPGITLDRHVISLQANIELDADLAALRRLGPTAVGLYRTEFLFINPKASPPGEEEQLRAYRKALRALRGSALTIRTYDLGGDKLFDGDMRDGQISPNPALGLRAVRLSLREPAPFAAQIRAILRASAQGPVRLMLPMLTDLSELDQCLALIAEQREALRRAGRPFDPDLPIGAMIEVPAAALTAEAFARRLDFLSIGTNDLIQYTLAIDRTDEMVNHLYDPLHPAVLQLIRLTLEGGARAGIPVAMCGEMAGDARYTRLLLGLGLREFSVPINRLAEIRHVIRNSDCGALSQPADALLATPDRAERLRRLQEINRDLDPAV